MELLETGRNIRVIGGKYKNYITKIKYELI